jgi:hypothetical protein
MTSDNNLLTVTLISPDLDISNIQTNFSKFIAVTATANVPPQGINARYLNMIKYKWGKNV